MSQHETQITTKCIRCGKAATLQRGLCSSHYNKYRRAKALIPEDHVAVWEQALIDEGMLLPDARPKSDPFLDVYAKLVEKGVIELGSSVAEVEPNQYSETPIKKKVKPPASPKKKSASTQRRKQA